MDSYNDNPGITENLVVDPNKLQWNFNLIEAEKTSLYFPTELFNTKSIIMSVLNNHFTMVVSVQFTNDDQVTSIYIRYPLYEKQILKFQQR